jgi:hypothetical protein
MPGNEVKAMGTSKKTSAKVYFILSRNREFS